MKKAALTVLGLVMALTLCACASMLERNYSSSADHVDYSVPEDSSILRAESYQALLNSIRYYVNEHSGGGTIHLYNYTGDVDADLTAVCSEVMECDPLAAYAVRDIHCTSTRILTYYEVEVHISYRRTIGELTAIQPTSGQNGVRDQLNELVRDRMTHSVLNTSYFSGDEQLVSSLFWLALYSDPVAAYGSPAIEVSFYPEEGSQRILELEAKWAITDSVLVRYKNALDSAAKLLLQPAAPVDGQTGAQTGEQSSEPAEPQLDLHSYTVAELAEILHRSLNYDPSGDHSALSAMQGDPVNDLGALLAMEYLCQLCGIEVMPVFDTAEAQTWLIVGTPSGYRHLLPRDLRPSVSEGDTGEEPAGSAWSLPLYTDEELSALGFTWPQHLHPACVDYSGAMPE